jgi:hypothetical protein
MNGWIEAGLTGWFLVTFWPYVLFGVLALIAIWAAISILGGILAFPFVAVRAFTDFFKYAVNNHRAERKAKAWLSSSERQKCLDIIRDSGHYSLIHESGDYSDADPFNRFAAKNQIPK